MRILGISGSLRRGSHNRMLLRAARAELPTGVDLVEWDGLAGLPAFNEDLERTPPRSVRAFLGFVADADALLIATPSTTRPSRARSRTRSTGHPARSPRTC
jgi:chromate reductase